MKKRDIYWRRYRLEETLYIRQWCLSPLQSSTLGPHIVPPITISCPVIFSWMSSTVWNLFPFKGDFSWEKSKVAGHQIWAVGELSHLGDLMFCQKNFAQDVMHEWVHYRDEAANHQLPIAAGFWIIQIVSMEKCSSLMQNLTQIHCPTHSVILNVMATQHTCSLNGICHPHWLVQWSLHCSLMHIPVHSPWLPCYIDVTHTVLFTLMMVGLFLDRPHII